LTEIRLKKVVVVHLTSEQAHDLDLDGWIHYEGVISYERQTIKKQTEWLHKKLLESKRENV